MPRRQPDRRGAQARGILLEGDLMKLTPAASLLLSIVALAFPPSLAAQSETELRVAGIAPYDRAAPGEIVELRVEGLGGRFTIGPPTADLQIQITQDGSTQTAAARTATPVIVREGRLDVGAGGGAQSPAVETKTYQAVTFVV